jgi:hypothetical protein
MIVFGRGVRRTLGLAALATVTALAPAAWAQKSFPTPEAAVDAFIDGVSRNDDDQVRLVLGADWKKFIPPESYSGGDVTNFLEAWSKGHRVVPAGDAKAYLEVGTRGWTMPIPLTKTAAGWRFDTQLAPDEMRTRRIGRNELDVIQVMLALTDAQQEYMAGDRNRVGAKQYAQKILSSPDKRDGLYWPTLEGEAPSPLGPIAAASKPGDAYHGYHYRVLTGQGKDAAGGEMSYVKNGQMTGGYAFVAWPAKYGDTGVMTFMVSAAGQVYQKNLGPGTDALARAMTRFEPDASWTKASP